MLLDDLDWSTVYRRLDAWQALTPQSRQAYVELRPSDTAPATEFGDDLEALVEAEFLVATSGVNVRIHPDAKPMVRAFRLMARHPFREEHDNEGLGRYLTELLVNHERRELLAAVEHRHGNTWLLAEHVSSIDWPRRFATPDPWDDKYPDRALPAARRLVAHLLETPGPMKLRDLPRHFDDVDEGERWAAVTLAIAKLAVFPAFLEGGPPMAEPGLTLWPPVARRHFAPPPSEPTGRTPEQSWAGALLLQDANTVLMAAAAEPLRIRQSDGAFYKRTAEDLTESLARLPEWLVEITDGLHADLRLVRARRLLGGLGLVQHREFPGGRVGLVPVPGAEAWIALGQTRQLHLLVDRWRLEEGFESGRTPGSDVEAVLPSDDDVDDDFDDEALDFGPSSLNSSLRHRSFNFGITGALVGSIEDRATAIRDAVGRLDGRGFVRLGEFAEYEAANHNPLDSDACDLRVGWGWRRDTTENRREVWLNELKGFVMNRMFMVDGARFGLDEERVLVFEPTSVGRFLVGLIDTFEREVPDESGMVVVQPDFEVVFLGPAPETESEVARFAERVGHGVGVLFRLTPEAAFGASAAGLTADRVFDTLRAATAQPIPQNVEHEIRAWFGRARRLRVRRTLIVECEDPEVVRRLSAAGGSDVRLLAESIVEIPSGKLGRRLLKRAAAQGLFLVPPGQG